MPLLNSIASPYADALLQVAEQRQEADLIASEAKELLVLWESSAELRDTMTSPVIEPDVKKKILVSLFGEQVTPALLNLFKLMADRQRLSLLDAVLIRFLELFREQRGITLASVTSATPLSEDQQLALRQKVIAVAGTESVEFDLSVDPALIGGFVVSLGSQVIDASLAGQVRRLGLSLAKAG
ncbi:F0F1 ATP synthase subunit delta [Synechococcus sp. CS-602]|uniref:ATP synthase F1 subunit delta n=1 Tax=Synechococcaceae TaxID=1890426 RepID=UPI0008FF38CE|nr:MULTISPECIES: ATP synthase F1 subunit delta [Synechococcaceae]MCT4363606.1 ATP synthase F1 subunit delta [Candidatus Regnicoccus frigidus MAG-AL1]APD48555.1 ATP synthase F1 subunit delta [Synechococcus sp. SynAce01]MCT0203158.1 F0F1 ATP synthase subunit delta [Synechococcus sp. CS-603]MCT0205363.1 F0F1 ATP synthase subunit delta [Synechococcus sp. CS-602]MCT0246857.1 F0F1 ATP synthase subunit delta [Synechococcus sp. CS-601]